ncbi:uncharacterized protein TRIREDRAFT_107591 [Trichoderma reesei QM6a]|uniref:Predicted protein n=2 Tax=Hypocrea jecorina TaxID=51453 RepID=G0RJ49_HYPJQ|nr:uncharacterized protein TRIREDRAFT_107591 [Trichoderma reesei QM6a]EGR48841.1 predicted protein [Trichoderma reesei QM6a]ETR97260.1 hypothetical protein M419DRAFT_92040 [Trichoderma reesei RUT C-30]
MTSLLPPQPPSTTSPASSLSPLLPILHAFNHRHHNQHRLAHWWPVFRILRRTLRALVDDLTSSSTSTSSSSTSSSSKLSSRPRRDAAALSSQPPPPPPRAIWLSKHFIPRAYIAFSQLAADNQHAPLGLLLLAVLSRVHAVVTQLLLDHTATSSSTSTTPLTSKLPPSIQDKRSIDVSSQDKGITISRDTHTPPTHNTERLRTLQTTKTTPTPTSSARHSSDDPRSGNVANSEAVTATKPSRPKSMEASSKDDKKKKKKKKGKGDELSSLFGSLA